MNTEHTQKEEEEKLNWDPDKVKEKLDSAFKNNSELELLKLLKSNSFLLYELYSRKFGIQPAFHEINFGGKHRCDFAWLNDNSDGPEWVLVEIEKPNMKLFTKGGVPTKELNHSLEQIRSWQRYFDENPQEKKRIFGAVAKFRYILVAGNISDWDSEQAILWRKHHNSTTNIEIRSSDVFYRAIELLEKSSSMLWSFDEHPITLPHNELEKFWKNYGYMERFRKIL